MAFASTPEPPYVAVIFTSTPARSAGHDGYAATAARMLELAAAQPGYLGVESAGDHDDGGATITVSYWTDLDAVAAWRGHAEHTIARETGRAHWYEGYELRVATVHRAVSWRHDRTS